MRPHVRYCFLICLILIFCGCGSKKKDKVEQLGFVVKGPVQNSKIEVYELRGSPLIRRDRVDSSRTGTEGSFSLQIDKEYRGYLLYEAIGGIYDDELTGNIVSTEKAQYPLSAIVSKQSDDLPNIYLTPFTTLKVLLATDSINQFNIQSFMESEAFINRLFGFRDLGSVEFKQPVLSSIKTSSPGTVPFDSFLMAKHLATFSQLSTQESTDGLLDSMDAVNFFHLDILDGDWDGLIGNSGVDSFLSPGQFMKAFQSVATNFAGMSTSSIIYQSITSTLITTTSFEGFRSLISPITTSEFALESATLLQSITAPDQLVQLADNYYLSLSQTQSKATLLEKFHNSSIPSLVNVKSFDTPNYTKALTINLSDQSILDLVFLTTSPITPLRYSLAKGSNDYKQSVNAIAMSTATTALSGSLVSGQFVGSLTSTNDLLFWDTLGNMKCVEANATVFSTCALTIETIFKFSKVHAVDINQDMRSDLIFTGAVSESANSTSVLIYINSGGNFLYLNQIIGDPNNQINASIIQDMSGDGLPDLLIAKSNGVLEYYEQLHNNQFDFHQALQSETASQITFIPFETNGIAPLDLLYAFEVQDQTRLYGIRKISREKIAKTTISLSIDAKSLSFLASSYTSDTFDDLLYTDFSASQILVRPHTSLK